MPDLLLPKEVWETNLELHPTHQISWSQLPSLYLKSFEFSFVFIWVYIFSPYLTFLSRIHTFLSKCFLFVFILQTFRSTTCSHLNVLGWKHHLPFSCAVVVRKRPGISFSLFRPFCQQFSTSVKASLTPSLCNSCSASSLLPLGVPRGASILQVVPRGITSSALNVLHSAGITPSLSGLWLLMSYDIDGMGLEQPLAVLYYLFGDNLSKLYLNSNTIIFAV